MTKSTRALALLAALSAWAFCASSCSSSSTTSGATGGPGPSPSAPSHSPAPATVSSTLDGASKLPQRLHWVARPGIPTARVAEVDFLIDGRLAWVEHNAPYEYGDDGNWLVTSFLRPGVHTFTTEVVDVSGHTLVDKTRADVPEAPRPPLALAGSWAREVGAAGSGGPPAGLWTYTFARAGLIGHDPQGGGGLSDVAYLSRSRLQLRPTIEHPPYPSPNNGGFCEDTDPVVVYSYALSAGGRVMTLRPASGSDPCANRQHLLAGTWHRVAQDPMAARLAAS
jgi:hypothetical protein